MEETLVWVVLFEVHHTLLGDFDVGDTGDGETTKAAEVGACAVDDVLVTEASAFAGGDSVGRFDGLASREGPAGATPALVLDWDDNVLFTPVDALEVAALGGERTEFVLRHFSWHDEAVEGAILGRGVSREAVEADLEGLALEALNAAEVGKEDTEADVVLFTGVEAAVLAHPRDEAQFLGLSHLQCCVRKGNKRKHQVKN